MTTFGQLQRLILLAVQQAPQREVVQAHDKHAPGLTILKRLHQHRLRSHRHGGGAKQQQAIAPLHGRGLAEQREAHWLQRIQQEEQQQEKFRAGQVGGLIALQGPAHADAQGEQKADDVHLPPALEPVQGKHKHVQQGEIAEQHDVTAAVIGCQHRRQERARNAVGRQPQAVLFGRQQRAGNAQQGEADKRPSLTEHAVARQHEVHQ